MGSQAKPAVTLGMLERLRRWRHAHAEPPRTLNGHHAIRALTSPQRARGRCFDATAAADPKIKELCALRVRPRPAHMLPLMYWAMTLT